MKVSDLNEGKMLPVSEGQGARTGDRCFQSVNGLMCLHQQVGSWNQGAGRRRDLRAERQPFTQHRATWSGEATEQEGDSEGRTMEKQRQLMVT